MSHNISITHVVRRSVTGEQAAQDIVSHHYLHTMPDPRTQYEIFSINLDDRRAGWLIFGRPESTRFWGWYGGLEDVASGRCPVTRWQVLNLARVFIHPEFQHGGLLCNPETVPGFIDRFGVWRPALASAAIQTAVQSIGFSYLLWRPPVFLDQPYEICWLLSYCDTRFHRGTIYKASGFDLYRTNRAGLQTWRIPMPALTKNQHCWIKSISDRDPRASRFRAKRDQLQFNFEAQA